MIRPGVQFSVQFALLKKIIILMSGVFDTKNELSIVSNSSINWNSISLIAKSKYYNYKIYIYQWYQPPSFIQSNHDRYSYRSRYCFIMTSLVQKCSSNLFIIVIWNKYERYRYYSRWVIFLYLSLIRLILLAFFAEMYKSIAYQSLLDSLPFNMNSWLNFNSIFWYKMF